MGLKRPETLKQIKKDAHLITSISPSRFDEEFKKMYNKSKKPSIGVKYLHSTGVMEHIFPKAKKKIQIIKGGDHSLSRKGDLNKLANLIDEIIH